MQQRKVGFRPSVGFSYRPQPDNAEGADCSERKIQRPGHGAGPHAPQKQSDDRLTRPAMRVKDRDPAASLPLDHMGDCQPRAADVKLLSQVHRLPPRFPSSFRMTRAFT